ncbi:MAG: DUF362 domain-containing protein [Desulfobacterales bacterium]|nr:DUF362 domain-containing protein [Desulfobacterales bacterium]
MPSKVYFTDLSASFKINLVAKLGNLMEAAGISPAVTKRDLVAVKLHFGEMGNTAFIRPVFLRKVVEVIRAQGASPFLTDANTLYAGTRSDAPSHLNTAIANGFAFSVVGAPLVIADGLRGKSETAVTVNLKNFEQVYIGSEIVEADALVSVAHFKGHELSGFGGTLKNLGMGCASRRGKLAQHSSLSPKVKKKKCIGCGECVDHCSQQALALLEGEDGDKAEINPERCIGCGECILACAQGAIQIQWNQSVPTFLENMMEYTAGVIQNKKDKALYINFITDVSPGCDCLPYNDSPIVRDIGILASTDPVAIDRASIDLVNGEHALPGTCLKKNMAPGEDKFGGVYDYIDWAYQFEYAEKIGLGSSEYELVKV